MNSDELSEAIAKAFAVPAHLLSVNAPGTYQQIIQVERFAALQMGSEILAKWDAAVQSFRDRHMSDTPKVTVSEDWHHAQAVHRLGFATPLWVSFGGPR